MQRLSVLVALAVGLFASSAHADVGFSLATFGGAAQHDVAYGGLDGRLRIDDTLIGLEVHGAAVRDAYVGGLQREDGARLRIRVPLQIALATASGVWDARRGLDFALVVGPQLRLLDVGDRRATAVGGDLGVVAHVWLLPRISLDLGVSLPFLIDVSGPGAGEVARFPGGTFALGTTLRASARVALSAIGRVVVTEGYGGDSEKQSLEMQLTVRFFFDDAGRGGESMLGQTL
jgi:hypothetical protein